MSMANAAREKRAILFMGATRCGERPLIGAASGDGGRPFNEEQHQVREVEAVQVPRRPEVD